MRRRRRALLGVGALLLVASACTDDGAQTDVATSVTTAPSTTAPSPRDPRLLRASEIGSDFADLGTSPVDISCSVVIPPAPQRLIASYVSEAAQELASEELRVFEDAAAADVALELGRRSSSCPTEGNLSPEGATARPASVAGADEGFGIAFTDGLDGVGSTASARRSRAWVRRS